MNTELLRRWITRLREDPEREGRRDPAVDWRVEFLAETDSTSRELLQRLEAESAAAAEGQVLVAGRQTAGEGRSGRRWECPAGQGLLFSACLALRTGRERVGLLGHAAALAVIQSLEQSAGLDGSGGARAAWKWPNDILLLPAGKSRSTRRRIRGFPKLGGILVQAQTQGQCVRAVLGVGLNLGQRRFPPGLRHPAVSLRMAGCPAPEPEELLARLLLKLESLRPWLAPGSGLLEELARRDACVGGRLLVEENGVRYRARLEDYEEDGAILLRTAEGRRRAHSGEIRLVLPGIEDCG